MFSYILIVLTFIIARYSHKDYRAISYLVAIEFLAHKLFFLAFDKYTGILSGPTVLLGYVLIETIIVYLIVKRENHLIISALILANIGYNMLTISQYVFPTYDFYGSYELFVRPIMVLELLYLVGITGYVRNYIAKHGDTSINSFDRLFCIRRRIYNR